MAVHLDHLIVPSRNRVASARLVAELLGVAWSEESGIGSFSAVYVNEGLTLDFDETSEPFSVGHFAFRVDPHGFDEILDRLRDAGIGYRSTPHGPVDMQSNTYLGGSIVYWDEPDGHIWEVLTVSYARQAASGGPMGAA